MSRKSIVNQKQDGVLSDCVDNYCNYKYRLDEFKTLVNDARDDLIARMKEAGLSICESSFNKIKLTQTERTTMDEEKAIEILKSAIPADVFSRVVKTKQVIDDLAFKDAVYDGVIDPEILSECITKTPVDKLQILKK